MNVLELFAGIGGLGLGLERASMTVVRTCVEWWRGAVRPAVDVVAGGFPCQPVSRAGRRQAQDDERWLWPAFAEVVRQLRPRYVVVENVPGLLDRGAGDVLGDLAAFGYDAEWSVVSACSFGAPHPRERVFIVAYPQGQRTGQLWRRGGTPESSGHWDLRGSPPEPPVARVADGVPHRLERLTALGNAVVPQVAEYIGRLVMAHARA